MESNVNVAADEFAELFISEVLLSNVVFQVTLHLVLVKVDPEVSRKCLIRIRHIKRWHRFVLKVSQCGYSATYVL